jgi:hypothetical protein
MDSCAPTRIPGARRRREKGASERRRRATASRGSEATARATDPFVVGRRIPEPEGSLVETDGSVSWGAPSDAFGVTYRTPRLTKRSRRSCFRLGSSREVRYRRLADHWLDPTRDRPPVRETHETVVSEVRTDVDSSGF